MHRSKLPYVFLALAAVLALSALILLIRGPRKEPEPPPSIEPAPIETPAVPGLEDTPEDQPPADPDTTLEDLGIRADVAENPAELVDRIAKALESGDPAALERLISPDVLNSESGRRLRDLATGKLRIRKDGVREVGEIERNQRTRWALELEGGQAGSDKLFLDLKRDGKNWSVEKITLPQGQASNEKTPQPLLTDSLGVADTFLQAVLTQNFEYARGFVDPRSVSDAKIAGLCILFEEGQYQLRKTKPLRSMFKRDGTEGYIATVEATGSQETAQFSITMRQPENQTHWLVAEINLDQLLADYAQRVAGGDVYYSPLVKNPSGGDTLALYFEFDQDEVNPRTRRQLEIVSMILKADPGKKLTLSGHTDSLGTDDYNHRLSARRAAVVRDFLVAAGVAPEQIVTVAKGASQPRRPNVTETGDDNPEGRRANRRTEIYLDF